jgi:hypothetical protein
MKLSEQFQRDINRVLDPDRNSRKRGLQKLHETLPWERKEEVLELIESQLFLVLISLVDDSVEKCREYSLKIIKSFLLNLKNRSISQELLFQLTFKLCSRVDDFPFPETAEELRLIIAVILLLIVDREKNAV